MTTTTTTTLPTLVDRIADEARRRLDRDAHWKRRDRDWPAWDAVRDAAADAGLAAPLLGYVTDAKSLRAMAEAFVARYAQAYGPVADAIEVGAHVGIDRPTLVRL